jgi:hypothetical protein
MSLKLTTPATISGIKEDIMCYKWPGLFLVNESELSIFILIGHALGKL